MLVDDRSTFFNVGPAEETALTSDDESVFEDWFWPDGPGRTLPETTNQLFAPSVHHRVSVQHD